MGIFDFVLGPAQMVMDWHNQSSNRQMQYDINARNEALTREAWGREDMAVQRRAADLEAAGFNRILAAGQGATTMGPTKLDSHSKENIHFRDMAIAEAAMNMMRMRDEFKTSRVNRDYILAQKDKVNAETDRIKTDARWQDDSFNMRLNELENRVTIQGEQQTLMELQQENYRLRNTNQESQNIITAVDAEFARIAHKYDLSEQMERIIKLEVENAMLKRDLTMDEAAGVPSNASLPEKAAWFIYTALERLESLGSEWVRRRNESRQQNQSQQRERKPGMTSMPPLNTERTSLERRRN